MDLWLIDFFCPDFKGAKRNNKLCSLSALSLEWSQRLNFSIDSIQRHFVYCIHTIVSHLYLKLLSTSINLFVYTYVTLLQKKICHYAQGLGFFFFFGNMKYLLGCESPMSNLSNKFFLRVDNVPAASEFPQLFQSFYMKIQPCTWM